MSRLATLQIKDGRELTLQEVRCVSGGGLVSNVVEGAGYLLEDTVETVGEFVADIGQLAGSWLTYDGQRPKP